MGTVRSTTICLACGEPLSRDLESVGAVRCQDCRDGGAPLRPELLEQQLDAGDSEPIVPAA
jgi:hypothetical protein